MLNSHCAFSSLPIPLKRKKEISISLAQMDVVRAGSIRDPTSCTTLENNLIGAWPEGQIYSDKAAEILIPPAN
jgi:hypothetical protein